MSKTFKGTYPLKGRVIFGNEQRDIEEFTERLRELGVPIPKGHVAWATDWKMTLKDSKKPIVRFQSYEIQGVGCESVEECLGCGDVFNYSAALHGHGCNICGSCSGTGKPVKDLT